MTGLLLTTDHFCVSYGQVQVLHDVAVAVPKGALVTVIGANGAGKTTLLNALIGLTASRGAVSFEAEPIASQPLEQRVRRGIGLVPERRELFSDMSVEDNLLLGGFRRSRAERRDDLEAVLQRFPRL
ncbi:MAG: ATP-binding cassette domain-containing protein, partial [Phreatobacter sp.]